MNKKVTRREGETREKDREREGSWENETKLHLTSDVVGQSGLVAFIWLPLQGRGVRGAGEEVSVCVCVRE